MTAVGPTTCCSIAKGAQAKSANVNLSAGEARGRRYADLPGVSLIFLSNREKI